MKNIFSKIKLKPRNMNKFKHGSYAAILTVVVVAIAIVFNTTFALLSERVNLDIDLTLTKDNSLDIKNVEFLESIDKEVKITVCASRADYTGGYMNYYAQNYYMTTDETGKYYEQTLTLLDLYSVYSDKITVEFVDPQTPEFADIYSKYSGTNIIYGDMIVECTHIIDGKEVVRNSVVSYKDIYYAYDSSGMAASGYDYYYVEGNDFETAMTGAIYKVVSEETYKVGYVSTHCDLSFATNLESTLKVNNFESVEIKDTVISKIDDEIDLLVIMAPKEDFMAGELEAINDWLIGDGSRGKGVLFFPSAYSPELPKLYGYLQEWGVIYDDGILFETNIDNYYTGDPTHIFSLVAETEEEEIAKFIEGNELFISKMNVPMKKAFEYNGTTRYTDILVETIAESVVIAPKDVELTWQPDNTYVKSKYPTAILAQDIAYIDNVAQTSYIAAFSSTDFIASSFVNEASVSNLKLVVNAAKQMVGQEKSPIEFTMKFFESDENYATTLSQGATTTMIVIFVAILPVAILIFGIVVFIKRRLR